MEVKLALHLILGVQHSDLTKVHVILCPPQLATIYHHTMLIKYH